MAEIIATDNLLNRRCYRTKGKNGVYSDEADGNRSSFYSSAIKDIEQINLTLEQFPKNHFFSLNEDDKKHAPNDLIISIQKQDNDTYLANTGNYIGSFSYAGHQIEIKSRFGQSLLERMLCFANNMYLSPSTGEDGKHNNQAQLILYFAFIQTLAKAFLMGFPKTYQIQRQHDANIRGNVDIAWLIQHDIPFKGKISSHYRERRHDLNIASVLLRALEIIQKTLPLHSLDQDAVNILHGLKQLNPPKPTPEIINQAINSKALFNPLFAPYKRVLKLAKLIIENDKLGSKKSEQENIGFIVNVAELFEHYVRSLLKQNFPDWEVHSPKIMLYEQTFFNRHIIPDIVMEKDGQVMVFDTKYKTMKFRGTKDNTWDLDRDDFFQIHSYMSYYQNTTDKQLIGGGLLYPLNDTPTSTAFSEKLFNDGNAWFCVDGLDFSRLSEDAELFYEEIQQKETEFIARIKSKIQ